MNENNIKQLQERCERYKSILITLAQAEIKALDSCCSCHINPPCSYCIEISNIAEKYGLEVEDLNI